jgi:hypothetical protein
MGAQKRSKWKLKNAQNGSSRSVDPKDHKNQQ